MSGERLLGGAGFAGRGLMKVIIADDMSRYACVRHHAMPYCVLTITKL
jgi:hypothetical protein